MRRTDEPGTRLNYSTLDTELLGVILSRSIGRTVADYMSERLWKPAGMESDAFWVMQGPAGRQHEFYGAGVVAGLRDYGRIGQLMLDGGRVGRRQVLPRAWVEQSTRGENGDAAYGFLWWGVRGMDAFAAHGVYGQHIYVDRTSRTVVVMASYGGQAAGGAGANADSMFRAIVQHLSGPTP